MRERTFKQHTWADNRTLQPEHELIEVSSDCSLDEGDGVLRTTFKPTPLSSGVEYFVQVEREEAEALLAALAVCEDGGGDDDTANHLARVANRVRRTLAYIASGNSDRVEIEEPDPPAPLAAKVAEAFPVGTHVKLKHDLDRYPHFIFEKGCQGVVVDDGTESGESGVFRVRMDDFNPGAKEWDNEMHWSVDNGDDPRADLDVVPARYLLLKVDVSGLSDRQVGHLEGALYAQTEAEDDAMDDDDPDYEGYPDVRVTSEVVDGAGNPVGPDAPDDEVEVDFGPGGHPSNRAENCSRCGADLEDGTCATCGGHGEPPEPRTVLVHLNVQADAEDPRTGDEIGDTVLAAVERGMFAPSGSLASDDDGAEYARLVVTAPLVEEV